MTKADEALLQFSRKYIDASYQIIIEALARAPMTASELNALLPTMTINGVKHAVKRLRQCKVIYVKQYLPHPGKPQMLLALGDYTDAPQIRITAAVRARRPKVKRIVIPEVPAAMLPTHTPRIGWLGL